MNRRILLKILAALVLVQGLAVQAAFAVLPDEMLPDAGQEARAVALSKNLRCVVCQNQNIDDSAAPIARDMRLLLRERIAAGDTDDKAVAYLVQRYGNYVLLKPPFQTDTILLWISPFAVLAIAAIGFFVSIRNRRSIATGKPLSASERQQLERLLNATPKSGSGTPKS
ncbi:MAG TPA: cytochrome c-type biogenesis protein [Rhizomicrobium sp.]|nr:cytochrome c-type biogenesis protein [Rhizomicrobium sp.]